jgi:hypothetical protein
MSPSFRTCVPAVALACTLFAAPAHALGAPLDDAELADVWGQALLDLTNTSLNGYDFSRLTLNADITLSATLTGVKLGTQSGGTSDIDISTISFGRSDAGEAARTVAITNPYFEWVYAGSGADRTVVGMRLGFGGISGDVGLTMNTVSGALAITTSSGLATSTGSQSTSLSSCSGTCTIALGQIGGVTAGDASGASRDFFVSVLKSALTWPTTNAALGTSATAQAGFWLNWTDRLTALNTTGTVPANVAKIGP